jgi:hypothetical protein
MRRVIDGHGSRLVDDLQEDIIADGFGTGLAIPAPILI